MLRLQQAPAAAVQGEDGIVLQDDGLDAVELPLDVVIGALDAVVDIAVVVIVRGAQAEDEAQPALIVLGQGFVPQQVPDPIAGALDGEGAVL